MTNLPVLCRGQVLWLASQLDDETPAPEGKVFVVIAVPREALSESLLFKHVLVTEHLYLVEDTDTDTEARAATPSSSSPRSAPG